jgi:hypothetical protein
VIKATVQEIRDAFVGFRNLGAKVRLPEKAAWRVGRLVSKLKAVVIQFEERQLEIFQQAGGVQTGGGIEIQPPTRLHDDSEDAWQDKLKAHREKMKDIAARIRTINAEIEEIDYDRLPRNLFKWTAEDKPDAREFSWNDLSDIGDFIIDTDEVKPKE